MRLERVAADLRIAGRQHNELHRVARAPADLESREPSVVLRCGRATIRAGADQSDLEEWMLGVDERYGRAHVQADLAIGFEPRALGLE